jgi:hypothetical protein
MYYATTTVLLDCNEELQENSVIVHRERLLANLVILVDLLPNRPLDLRRTTFNDAQSIQPVHTTPAPKSPTDTSKY